MKSSAFFLFLSVLLAALEPVSAAPEHVVRYSHIGMADPMVQASGAHAVVFKAELERLSKGRIRVDIFPAGQLAGQVSSVQQVRKGTIHMADISSGVLASLYYEPLEILDMPYLFSSRAVARIVLDNQNPFTRKLIDDCAKKTGVRILAFGTFGFRHMTNNVRPITVPQDMQGLKMRTMEIVPHMKLMESLGATPVPVPWLELYTSLQTNVVDGEETTLQNMAMGKLYQVQKHLTLTEHLMGVGAFLCNEKWYKSLPDELRRAVVEAEQVALLTYDGFGKLLDTVALEELQNRGMEIHKPTPHQMQMFKDKALPQVRRWMEEKHGKEFVAEFFAAIKAAQEQLKLRAESTRASSQELN